LFFELQCFLRKEKRKQNATKKIRFLATLYPKT
jgi:hypothetical protein